MSYVNYNQSLYRTGFRPYGHTDPFAASQLNGLGQYHPFTESGGWPLHGFGQVHPFGPWTLHGLGDGAGVPDGAVITYVGKWTTGHTALRDQDPQGLVNAVVDAINQDGQLRVLQAPQTLNASFGTQVGNIFGQTQTVPVTLTLQVTNGQGFQSVNDPISIINHYVYAVSGMMPQSGNLTSVRTPSAGGGGSPDYQTAGIDPVTGLPYGAQQPTDFTTWLENNALWLGLGIGALVLLPKLL